MDSKFRRIGLILSILILVFFGFYLQGIPFEQEGGVRGWWQSSQTPWAQMFSYLFSLHSERPMAGNDILIQTRVTESIIQKGLFALFGDSIGSIAIFNLLVVVLFAFMVLWFTTKWTGNLPVATLTVIFLLTTPAYGWSIMEYGDYAPFDQLLLLLYFGMFIPLFEKILREEKPSLSWRRILNFVLLWLVGVLALRVKEPNKFLIPGLSALLIVFNPGGNLFRTTRDRLLRGFLPLCGLALLWGLPTVLVKEPPGSPLFHWDGLKDPFYIFFWNPFGFEKERFCTLFSWRRAYPSSILSNFGFFLNWALIAAGTYLSLTRKGIWKKPDIPHVSIPLLLTGWTLTALAFHVVFKSLEFTRYLMWALLPFTLLVAMIFSMFFNQWEGRTRKVLAIALISFAVLRIFDNLQHSLYARKALERIWVPKWEFRAQVYKDQKGLDKAGLFEFYSYWFPRTEFTKLIEPYLEHERDRQQLAADPQFRSILEKFGVAYVASPEPLTLPWKTTLIREMNQKNFSILTAFKKRFSKKPMKRFYLYRVNPE